MEKIKHLYKGINFLTIPKVILNELRQHSNRRSSKSVRGKDGKFTTTYGDMLNPMFMYFNQYNFYINIIFYDELVKKIDTGLCFDENKIKIDKQNVALFFNEYGKGFIKGYDEFESKIKVSSSLFSVTNEQISYKIYSRIKGIWTSNIGDFKIECPINSDLTFLFTKENFFESGINGGEFYKAWEIILNNPTIFEPIFLANAEKEIKQPESEAIDLSDTTATEKIIYLHKLGVIDFLRTKQPFISVPDKVSQVISAFTGIKIDSVRPMIRPILNNDFEDRKNPLNSKNPVNKVTKQLNEIGFNLDETI